jgi:hypothetical protein
MAQDGVSDLSPENKRDIAVPVSYAERPGESYEQVM